MWEKRLVLLQELKVSGLVATLFISSKGGKACFKEEFLSLLM